MNEETTRDQALGTLVPDLAEPINLEHQLAQAAAASAVRHAIICGLLLIRQKATPRHGKWLPWLAANVGFSQQTANNYVHLAANYQRDGHWLPAATSLRQALELLRDRESDDTTERDTAQARQELEAARTRIAELEATPPTVVEVDTEQLRAQLDQAQRREAKTAADLERATRERDALKAEAAAMPGRIAAEVQARMDAKAAQVERLERAAKDAQRQQQDAQQRLAELTQAGDQITVQRQQAAALDAAPREFASAADAYPALAADAANRVRWLALAGILEATLATVRTMLAPAEGLLATPVEKPTPTTQDAPAAPATPPPATPAPEEAQKGSVEAVAALPADRKALAQIGHEWLREGMTMTGIAVEFNRIGWTPNRIGKPGAAPRADSAKEWNVKTMSQLLKRDCVDLAE